MIHNLNILIVDDEIVNTILLEELVSQEGYTKYIVFNNSIDAYNYALNNDVDVLITDYNMPELNGIDLLKLIKTIHRDLVSIMITADNNSDMMIKALENHARDLTARSRQAPRRKIKILKWVLGEEGNTFPEITNN